LLFNGEEKEVAASDLKIGDIVIVKSGERIPVDGEIIEGRTFVFAFTAAIREIIRQNEYVIFG